MEFHVTINIDATDLTAIESAIHAVDPAGQVDRDPLQPALRVAATLDSSQLVQLINQCGTPVTLEQVRQLPSICCGGCSG